jgi:hypothetical protein
MRVLRQFAANHLPPSDAGKRHARQPERHEPGRGNSVQQAGHDQRQDRNTAGDSAAERDVATTTERHRDVVEENAERAQDYEGHEARCEKRALQLREARQSSEDEKCRARDREGEDCHKRNRGVEHRSNWTALL